MSTADAMTKSNKESPSKEPEGYLSALAGGKSPVSMPPIPAWMLNTPIYSKLPMIPAPKGKITLYTTGLGEKLYPTPSGLDFDPSAEGLNSEYKSLHDPHLKSHYTEPTTFRGLIRKKFITPEGKVICTLKEFNEYHQYLKRVYIEKLAQDRKGAVAQEREERERQRQEWSNKEELSPHDKQVLETQARKEKILKEKHLRLSQRLEQDAVRHLRLLEDRQTKRSIEKARSKLERERRRNKRIRMELEEHINRGTKRMNLAEDERRHADLLKCYRMSVKDRRQLKLEDQWNRHQKIREKHRVEDIRRQKELETRIEHNIDTRRQSVANEWTKQLSTFENIRDTRAMRRQRQEAKIKARLEKKLKAVRKLFEQRRRKPVGGRRRKRPRHGLGGPRHYSSWAVERVLDKTELSPADGVWKIVDDRYLPVEITSPVPPPSPIVKPTITVETVAKLPPITKTSRDIAEEIQEEESLTEIKEDREFSLSSLELAVIFGDHYDSFIASARDLVGNVLHALEIEKRSIEIIPKEAAESEAESETTEPEVTPAQETKLPEPIRRTSVLQLTNSTVARLVLSKVFGRAKEQITAEGGLPQPPVTTPTREALSDVITPVATETPSITRQTSMREIHLLSPITKVGVMSEELIKPTRVPTPHCTSSSLLAAAVVSDALRKVTRELEQESQRSDTSILAENMVTDAIKNVTNQLQWELSESVTRELEQEPSRSDTSILAEDVVRDAIRNVTSQLQKELSESVARELQQEPQRSDTSLLAEDVVRDAIRNVTSQLQKELSEDVLKRELERESQRSDTSILAEEVVWDAIKNVTSQLQGADSGTRLIAERVVADAIRSAAQQLRAMPQIHSRTSLLAEELASTAISNASRQLHTLLPQSSSSIIAEAIAADAVKNVMRQLGAQPPQTSSSILAQAFAADALKNATIRLGNEQIMQALYPPAHTSSSLLAQAITNSTLQKVTRQLQRERETLQPHTSSSLLAQAVTNDALAKAVRQLEKRSPSPHTDSSLLAQAVTREALQNAAVQLQIEKGLKSPYTSSSMLAHNITVDALQNAVAQLTPTEKAPPLQTSSSRLAQITADDALQTAKEQLWTERASSRCRSRGSRSSSPFSPELAKSAVNQTSPEPAQSRARARSVASDIVQRTSTDVESPSPTRDIKTPSPAPRRTITASTDTQHEGDENASDGLSSQARTVVMHIVEGALASLKEDAKDGQTLQSSEESKVEGEVVDVHRSSILLATVNDVFRESETDVSHHHHPTSSESEDGCETDLDEDPGEEDEIIGVVENEVIAEEESVHSLAECIEGTRVEGLTSVVKKSHNKTIFEGAVIPHDKTHESVTEKVLSVQELHKDESGHLVHDASSKSLHRVTEGGEYSQEGILDTRHHYSNIVPVYHSHPLNLEEEIIAHNLSAISMKPDKQHKVPSAYSASSRNSFRNMFRPDMTHCQGSAKCLKDSLVKELSHQREDDHVCGVLDRPHEDITAHHSDEELVRQEETGGVCYLPQRKTYKAHQVVDHVVPEEGEPSDSVREEDDGNVNETLQDCKDTPAGGDYKSPDEEEVEPTVPVSRVSTRSIRSGKSREIQSRAESKESSPSSSSPRKGSSNATPIGKSKGITETSAVSTASQAAASRSVIGAVISRVSSIFSRKHSTKIHPGSTDEESTDKREAEKTSSHTRSRSYTCAEEDIRGKADDDTHFKDACAPKYISDAEETAEKSVIKSKDGALAASDKDPPENEEPRNTTVDVEVRPLSTTLLEKPKDEGTCLEPKGIQSELLEEKNKPISEECLPRKIPADQPALDREETSGAQGTDREMEESLKPVSESEVANRTGEPLQIDGKSSAAEKLEASGSERKPVEQTDTPELTQKKTSFGDENKRQDEKKALKSGSDSGLERIKAKGSKTPRPHASLTTVSRSAKSSGGFSDRSRQKSFTPSASPKSKGRTPSPHSTKTHAGQGTLSAHSTRQQARGTETSLAKPPSGSFIPNMARQRSHVSKPPSTGSVRLIKVSPAPSMSSERRRSGKLSSASVGKLISGKTSGGSVRLINVSPAASTAIGPRRSSRHSEGIRSSSETRVKAFVSSSSAQKVLGEKGVSRKTSRSSVPSKNQTKSLDTESPQGQKQDEATGPRATLAEGRLSSAGSFVIIDTPPETPSTEEQAPASGESSGFGASTKQQNQNADRDLSQAKEPEVVGSGKDVEIGFEDEQHEEKCAQEASETKKSLKIEEPATSSDELDAQAQQGGIDQPQEQQKPPPTGGDSEGTEVQVARPDEIAQDEEQIAPESFSSSRAAMGRRSGSIISAVIERLSRIFSGEAPAGSASNEGRRKSGTKMEAMKTDAKSESTLQRGEGSAVRQSQSTGPVPSLDPDSDGQETKVGTRLVQRKSTQSEVKRSKSSGDSSKVKMYPSGSALPVPPNSGASDSSTAPNVLPGTVARISTTYSGEATRSTSSIQQDVGSNSLPPVEDVETSNRPPSTPDRVMSPKEMQAM